MPKTQESTPKTTPKESAQNRLTYIELSTRRGLRAPMFCPAKQVRCAVWLPVKAFILAGSFALCTELVFGAGNALPGIELLRAGRLGSISRFDALVLLVWLAAAMFRFCVLVQVVRQLAGRLWGRATPAEENA